MRITCKSDINNSVVDAPSLESLLIESLKRCNVPQDAINTAYVIHNRSANSACICNVAIEFKPEEELSPAKSLERLATRHVGSML
ncbi:hypothetical protein [Alteromonas flava]|uniref:hypothetical protein n=1 Tax=Alteromonas flava TaxID=2048003 RepID=UPI000C2814D0|nr:hypothetical protein [Alteromonas flava]